MTNNDNVAGLCERLRSPILGLDYSPTDNIPPHHLNNPDGRQAADLIERQAAEIKQLQETIEMANIIAHEYYTCYDFSAEDAMLRLIDILSGEDQ